MLKKRGGEKNGSVFLCPSAQAVVALLKNAANEEDEEIYKEV